MKIENFKKLNGNRYKLKLVEEEDLILYDDIILKYNLLLTKNIEKKEIEKIKKENKDLECYYKAIKYLTGKSRCKKEIEKYLKRFLYEDKEIYDTIKKLEDNNYLNDDDYLKSFINDQIHLTNNGPYKIKRKLLDMGFDEVDIEEKLNKIDNKIWQEKLENIIPKKVIANKKDSECKIKEKILYTYKNEGYKKEDILNILEKVEFPNNEFALESEANKLYIKLSRRYKDRELFYYLRMKLLAKGFKNTDIDNIIDQIKKSV